jgi:hypothetical protein
MKDIVRSSDEEKIEFSTSTVVRMSSLSFEEYHF